MRSSLVLVAVTSLAAPALAGPGPAPILGGTPAQVGQFPNVVVLEVGNGLCTGTLVTKDWILTAAHCVTPAIVGEATQAALTASIRVHFNTINVNQSAGTVVRAADSIPDPGFNANNLGSHDSGLIKLATPVTDITPVPINFVAANAPVGVHVTMVGFGATATGGGGMVGVEMVVDQTSEACQGIGSDADLLCFSQISGKGKCEGDSGGPSFAMVGGHLLEVGVTSFGDQTCSQFGADTRVDAEQAFIVQHIPELACGMDATCNAACGMNGLPVDPDCPVCQLDTDCTTSGDVCFKGQCVLGPTAPMGLGTTCTAGTDCQSGACGTGPDGMRCVEGCTVGAAGTCPTGFDCLGASSGAGACWPSADTGAAEGPCSSSGGGASLMLIGVALAVCCRRRRA